MKKIILSLILLMSFMSLLFVNVSAYSEHYLPGGKNYISSDNLIKVDNIVSTISPFLVKPYTEYTLSISRDHIDGRPFYLNIYLYSDYDIVNEISMTESDMDFDYITNIYSYTFTTSVETNYLEFDFTDNGYYVSGTEFIDLQLEEGAIVTAYETYIPGNIMDTQSPYFIGSSTVISYFDQPITVSEIQSSLTAYDDIDGDLTANITVLEDNYTEFMYTLGTYNVKFQVMDNSGNTTDITINVEVVDILPPVFSDIGILEAVYPNVYTVEEVIQMLSASDNYEGDVSGKITLVEDNYSLYANIVGSYSIEFMVSDLSGNISYHTQEIIVTDKEAPILNGPETFDVGYDQILTIDYVKDNLTAIDNYDLSENLEIILESENYSTNHNQLGTYEMKFSVTDSSGNKTIKTISINVVDEIGPMIYFDSSIIQVYSDTVLGLPDFAKLLVQTSELEKNTDYFITVRYDSYSKFSNTPGTYHMYLDFEDGYGNIISKDFEVRVIERNYDYVYSFDEEELIQENTLNPVIMSIIGGSGTIVLGGGGFIIYKFIRKRKFN